MAKHLGRGGERSRIKVLVRTVYYIVTTYFVVKKKKQRILSLDGNNLLYCNNILNCQKKKKKKIPIHMPDSINKIFKVYKGKTSSEGKSLDFRIF